MNFLRGSVTGLSVLILMSFGQSAYSVQNLTKESKVVSSTCTKGDIALGSAHIAKQIGAFKFRNLSSAYSFASKEFRSSKTLKEFEQIISSKYSMLLDYKNYKVTSCDKKGQFFMFILELLDKQGSAWEVRYLLSNPKGVWGVEAAAASLIESPKIKA